ncbi:MAG: DUF1674 domain-containing protein [Steroidobacter sp.]
MPSGTLAAMSRNGSQSSSGSPSITNTESDGAQNESGAVSKPAEAREEAQPREVGGREGPDPTRYGDWEKNGRCIDF